MVHKNFTKADLKVGYVVKQRDGDLSMIMPGLGGKMVTVNKDGRWSSINSYNADLCCPGCSTGDIMEVYGYSSWNYRALTIETVDRDLLWKREDPKKMTVKEIAEALGYPVEIVEG
jgi:hypothetical protein